MQRDPYRVLELARNADADAIKKAFRRLAKANHPDLHPDDPDAEERFQELQAAYALLSDPARRADYDAGDSPFVVEPIDPAALGFDRVFTDLFAAPAGAARARRPTRPTRIFSPQATPDPNFADLEAGLGGAGRTVTVRISPEIARDGGLIAIPTDGAHLRFRIPAGTHDGARMRLPGKSADGGDLIARIVVG